MREEAIRERLEETRGELERIEAEYRVLLDLTRDYERWLAVIGAAVPRTTPEPVSADREAPHTAATSEPVPILPFAAPVTTLTSAPVAQEAAVGSASASPTTAVAAVALLHESASAGNMTDESAESPGSVAGVLPVDAPLAKAAEAGLAGLRDVSPGAGPIAETEARAESQDPGATVDDLTPVEPGTQPSPAFEPAGRGSDDSSAPAVGEAWQPPTSGPGPDGQAAERVPGPGKSSGQEPAPPAGPPPGAPRPGADELAEWPWRDSRPAAASQLSPAAVGTGQLVAGQTHHVGLVAVLGLLGHLVQLTGIPRGRRARR